MRYKLIGENNFNDLVQTVFNNRGIQNIDEYINESAYHTDENADGILDNINEAMVCLYRHVYKGDIIKTITDPDADGFCSNSMLINGLKDIYPDINIGYYLHDDKQHGITDTIVKDVIKNNVKLLIVADAATNDAKQCKILHDNNCDVIILDHHEKEIENPNAIIVNPFCCDYPNKQICGATVVYKFLQAIDDKEWTEYADRYSDLNALGLISDCMDITKYETKYLIQKGLHNIQNKMFAQLIEKNSYNISDIDNPTIHDIQWYVTPSINSLIRCGSDEDKENLFKGFLEDESQVFDYKKRGSTEITQENIYEHMARLCTNAHGKQSRTRDKCVPKVIDTYNESKYTDSKIAMIKVDNTVPKTFTGLVAVNVAEKIGKPTIIVRDGKNGMLSGSLRNIDNSYIENFKDFLTSTGCFEFIQGHQSAAGVGICAENVQRLFEIVDKKLKSVDCDKTYHVDFVMDFDDISLDLIRKIDSFSSYIGQGFDEPLICIKNIEVSTDEVFVMGKNSNSWKFRDGEIIEYVKFKCNEDDKILTMANNGENKVVTLNAIGECKMSTYNGKVTPTIIIKDYEFI